MKYIKYTKLKEITNLNLSRLIWYFFTSSAFTMRKSAKKTTITGSNDSENSYEQKYVYLGSSIKRVIFKI